MLRLTLKQAEKLGLKISSCPPAGKSTLCQRRGKRMPDEVLWDAVRREYPEAEREYKGVVPGRRYRIDIALPALQLAIEIDGWAHHGQHRKAHAADRTRQNLIAVQGWMILRFTAGQVFKELALVMSLIEEAVRCQTRCLDKKGEDCGEC